MFKNPLKYQSGGSTPTQQQQEQLVQLFQAAAQNAQVDPEALVKKAQELGQDENAAAQFMEGLQRCAQGDPAGIQFIKSLFTPSHKRGGKIQDFICKHGKGGAVAGCGCEKPIEKHQQENGKGRGIIGALSGLYNRFIGQRMPDVPGINNRRVRTWTDANGIQHIVEDANVNGNSTVTTIDINGADTLGTQKITTGDGRYRMVNLQPGTPQWRSVMSRNIPQQENGGKVEKARDGKKVKHFFNSFAPAAYSSRAARLGLDPNMYDAVLSGDVDRAQKLAQMGAEGTVTGLTIPITYGIGAAAPGVEIPAAPGLGLTTMTIAGPKVMWNAIFHKDRNKGAYPWMIPTIAKETENK